MFCSTRITTCFSAVERQRLPCAAGRACHALRVEATAVPHLRVLWVCGVCGFVLLGVTFCERGGGRFQPSFRPVVVCPRRPLSRAPGSQPRRGPFVQPSILPQQPPKVHAQLRMRREKIVTTETTTGGHKKPCAVPPSRLSVTLALAGPFPPPAWAGLCPRYYWHFRHRHSPIPRPPPARCSWGGKEGGQEGGREVMMEGGHGRGREVTRKGGRS